MTYLDEVEKLANGETEDLVTLENIMPHIPRLIAMVRERDEALKIARDVLNKIAPLNEYGPYEAIRAPEMAMEALAKIKEIGGEDDKR